MVRMRLMERQKKEGPFSVGFFKEKNLGEIFLCATYAKCTSILMSSGQNYTFSTH